MNFLIEKRDFSGAAIDTVNARTLHANLEVGKVFAAWITERIEQYDFKEGRDYVVFSETGNNPQGGRPSKEYALSIDMAKSIAMVQNNEAGRRVRAYFIEMERLAKTLSQPAPQFQIPQTLSQALMLAARQAEQIEQQAVAIADMTPKAEFHDDVANAINAQDFQEVAKILGTGRTRLTRWLRLRGFIMENLQPYQNYIDDGYFRVVEKKRNDPVSGEIVIYTKTLITGKGVTYLQRKWAEDHGLRTDAA